MKRANRENDLYWVRIFLFYQFVRILKPKIRYTKVDNILAQNMPAKYLSWNFTGNSFSYGFGTIKFKIIYHSKIKSLVPSLFAWTEINLNLKWDVFWNGAPNLYEPYRPEVNVFEINTRDFPLENVLQMCSIEWNSKRKFQ